MPDDYRGKRRQHHSIQNCETSHKLSEGFGGLERFLLGELLQLVRVFRKTVQAEPDADRDNANKDHHNGREFPAIDYLVFR